MSAGCWVLGVGSRHGQAMLTTGGIHEVRLGSRRQGSDGRDKRGQTPSRRTRVPLASSQRIGVPGQVPLQVWTFIYQGSTHCNTIRCRPWGGRPKTHPGGMLVLAPTQVPLFMDGHLLISCHPIRTQFCSCRSQVSRATVSEQSP